MATWISPTSCIVRHCDDVIPPAPPGSIWIQSAVDDLGTTYQAITEKPDGKWLQVRRQGGIVLVPVQASGKHFYESA